MGGSLGYLGKPSGGFSSMSRMVDGSGRSLEGAVVDLIFGHEI